MAVDATSGGDGTLTSVASTHGRNAGDLVIRPLFAAGPLTLSAISDVPGHVAHLDIDDAGVYLECTEALRLAAGLELCASAVCDRDPAELVMDPRFGVGALTLVGVNDVPGQVADLDINGARVYLERAEALRLAAGLQRCAQGSAPGSEERSQ